MKVMAILLAVLLTGCASRAGFTAGEIGCPEDEIQISQGSMGWQTNTWTAQCRGKTFICTYSSSYNLSSRTQCREAIASTAR